MVFSLAEKNHTILATTANWKYVIGAIVIEQGSRKSASSAILVSIQKLAEGMGKYIGRSYHDQWLLTRSNKMFEHTI